VRSMVFINLANTLKPQFITEITNVTTIKFQRLAVPSTTLKESIKSLDVFHFITTSRGFLLA
jgi:hypothetical protein